MVAVVLELNSLTFFLFFFGGFGNRRMGRLWIGAVEAAELLVSAIVHLLYGLYIFSTAVASDLSQTFLGADDRPPIPVSTEDAGPLPPPIVLLHGIFGFGKGRLGGLSYFGGAEKKDDRVLVPDLGSLTSIHDRARDLFYYLKGGRVDYGEEHSRIYGHGQFGRIYITGHYPEWDDQHPIHFVGHSAGAQVVRVLQQMLSDKAFEGFDTSEDWVLSLTSLSGALNGTTRTYMDGMLVEEPEGRSMKPICLLQLCRLGTVIYDWLDIKWLKNYYNFGFDHFEGTWRKIGILGLVDSLLGNIGPFATGDWILPDLTIQGSMRMNSNLKTFKNTYYFSYATKRTGNLLGYTLPSSLYGIHPLLLIRVLQMSLWRYPHRLPPIYKGYRDEDWQDNDGAMNTISMTHPRIPIEHPSHFVADDSELQCTPMEPGVWYYKIIEADHIFYILNRDRAGVLFDRMYDGIFDRCRKNSFRTIPLPPPPIALPS